MTIPSSKRWRLKIRNFSGVPKQWSLPLLGMYIASTPNTNMGETGPTNMVDYSDNYPGGSYLAEVFGSSEAAVDSVQGYELSFVYDNPLVPSGHSFAYEASCANGNQTCNGVPPPPSGHHPSSGVAVPIYNFGGGPGGGGGAVYPYANSPWITEESEDDQWIEYRFENPVQVANYLVSTQVNNYYIPPAYRGSGVSDDPDYWEGYKTIPTDWDFQYWNGRRWVTIDSRRDRSFNLNDLQVHADTGAYIGYVNGTSGWADAMWYSVQTGAADGIEVGQYAVEVLRDNGDPQQMDFDQMAVEVLRFNGDELGESSRDEIPGENPSVGNWFSMF